MNNETHTPERWTVDKDGCICKGEPNAMNFIQLASPFREESYWGEPLASANARRIVACVNACEKLSNEFLSSGGIYEIGKELLDTKKQRDELASLLTLIKIGLESGAVESKPIMDMGTEEAESIEPVALLSLINTALAKLK